MTMLSKKIDWSVLAQCDYYAVERLVQTVDRPAMKTVQPMREAIFERKLAHNSHWQEAYNVLCKSYQDLSPTFSIEHDNFGGYRLMFRGEEAVRPPFVFKRLPVGFIRPIPEGVVTNLSVMSSERTGQQLLLLGPIRFVNSDCNPNCEYGFSSDAGIVQLRVRKRINQGDEIFVKYGPEFFEANSCLCRTCVLTRRLEEKNAILFETILDDLVMETAENFLSEQKLSQNIPPPKKRRIRGREMVALYNTMTTAEIEITLDDYKESDTDSDHVNLFEDQNELLNSEENSDAGEVDNINGSDSENEDSRGIASLDPTVRIQHYVEQPFDTHSNYKEYISSYHCNNQVSSPLSSNFENPACSLSTLLDENSCLDLNSRDKVIKENECKIYDGSNIGLHDASTLAELFCSQFHLSDEASNCLYSMIKVNLPPVNRFPSSSSHIQSLKQNFPIKRVFFLEKFFSVNMCFEFSKSAEEHHRTL